MQLREIGKNEVLGLIEASDWQEANDATELQEIKIKTAEGRMAIRERVRRRAVDARLWGAMSSSQQTAAERIAMAFRVITTGLGSKPQIFEKTYGRGASDEYALQLLQDYGRWKRKCGNKMVSAALEVLVSGHSCAGVDRLKRTRKGTSRSLLFDALDNYCQLKQWN